MVKNRIESTLQSLEDTNTRFSFKRLSKLMKVSIVTVIFVAAAGGAFAANTALELQLFNKNGDVVMTMSEEEERKVEYSIEVLYEEMEEGTTALIYEKGAGISDVTLLTKPVWIQSPDELNVSSSQGFVFPNEVPGNYYFDYGFINYKSKSVPTDVKSELWQELQRSEAEFVYGILELSTAEELNTVARYTDGNSRIDVAVSGDLSTYRNMSYDGSSSDLEKTMVNGYEAFVITRDDYTAIMWVADVGGLEKYMRVASHGGTVSLEQLILIAESLY